MKAVGGRHVPSFQAHYPLPAWCAFAITSWSEQVSEWGNAGILTTPRDSASPPSALLPCPVVNICVGPKTQPHGLATATADTMCICVHSRSLRSACVEKFQPWFSSHLEFSSEILSPAGSLHKPWLLSDPRRTPIRCAPWLHPVKCPCFSSSNEIKNPDLTVSPSILGIWVKMSHMPFYLKSKDSDQ